MDPHIEHAYVSELLNQCQAALAAVQRMDAAMQAAEARTFFQHAQAFVVHAAALSRLLWPPRIRDQPRHDLAQRRGSHLRQQFQIGSGHPLEDRSLRNHVEHFDERLDDWASSSTSFSLLDLNIMPVNAVSGAVPTDNFRQYDPQTFTFYFRGDAFELPPIVCSVDQLAQQAEARLLELRAQQTPHAGQQPR